ncbi:MAG: putative rane protein, partial [Bacteroidota bacterium]|nr:putative rane protein [Bacteroidota bacterium]
NDPNDPAITNGRNVNFDLSVGINYHFKGLNVGFSVPQVLGNKVKFKQVDPSFANSVNVARQYIAIVSYEAKLGKKKDWSLTPFVMVNFIKKSLPVYLDITLMAAYKHLAWLAFGYDNGGGLKPNGDTKGFFMPNAAGIHATAGVSIKELVDINYTFKTTVGKKGNLVPGNLGFTHEVLLSFRLKRKTDQSEFEKNKKRTDDDIAKVNAKADDAVKKADDANTKVDSLGNVVDKLGPRIDSLGKNISDIKSSSDKNTTDIEKVASRLDNIVYKKFGSVYFEVDKSELTDEAKASIDAFKAKLGEMKGNYFIYLAGSASVEGSASYNQSLSTKRCNAVKQYIEGIGIAQRVLLLPYGENAPVTDKQAKEDDRAKNRRVDIYLSGE